MPDGTDDKKTFDEFGLAASIAKALKESQFINPTTIQQDMIPSALKGQDVLACAKTGSGKTLAFLIPALHRLMKNPTPVSHCRCVVLSPTRELAGQTHLVLERLLRYTRFSSLFLSGGAAVAKSEEEALMRHPEFLVATPGRVVDHLVNLSGFSLGEVEIVVLDEADRLLDSGFAPQLSEILGGISEKRQTLMVTATLDEPVKRLAAAYLSDPVEILAADFAEGLRQEFVRIDPTRRTAALVALIRQATPSRILVFFNRKRNCHWHTLLFELLGMKLVELRGNMSQARRFENLARFKEGAVNLLLSTDVAARGLDIPGVDLVFNFECPHDFNVYVHRVGRTARLGRTGLSLTLVGFDWEREAMKKVLERASAGLFKRTIAADVLEQAQSIVTPLVEKVQQRLGEEQASVALDRAESQIATIRRMLAGTAAPQKRGFMEDPKKRKRDVKQVAAKLKRQKGRRGNG